MLRKSVGLFVALFCLLFATSTALAGSHGEHGKASKEKVGILLVTFGTSYPEAVVSFENIDKQVKKTFPDVPVHWAYTSKIIRKKLAGQGDMKDSVETALAKMMDEGFTDVAVQSLHMIPGSEFNDLKVNSHAFQFMAGGIHKITLGAPMLNTTKDMDRAVDAVLNIIPPERKKGEAVVLMGHGTHHSANAFYEAMMYKLQKKDSDIYMGTVEGSPTLDDIMEMLIAKKTKKAYLIPFMSVAGDHARNDLAGDEEDSWKTVLSEAGIQCVPVLKGLAEFDEFNAIWIDHLKRAMKHLN